MAALWKELKPYLNALLAVRWPIVKVAEAEAALRGASQFFAGREGPPPVTQTALSAESQAQSS